MAINFNPIFIGTPKAPQVSTGTSANTNLDGSGVISLLYTAGAFGGKIEKVYLQHLGTNVATVVRFFLDNTGSNGYKLLYEVGIPANTLDQTAASNPQIIQEANFIVPAGGKIGITIGTAVASGLMVTGQGGDY